MKNHGLEMVGRFVNQIVTNSQLPALDVVAGRIVYNTDTNRFYICDGVRWQSCGSIHVNTIVPSATHNATNGYKVGDIWCKTDTSEIYICINAITPIWIKLLAEASIVHNAIGGLQGGTSGQFYHLTSATYGATAGTSGTPSAANKFVTNNDPRLPTADENNALLGTSGTPNGTDNRFVTNQDPRLAQTFDINNVAILAYDGIAGNLVKNTSGEHVFTLSLFSGNAGFDYTKIRGIWVQCICYLEANAYSGKDTYVAAKLFGSATYTTIFRNKRGADSASSDSISGLLLIPISIGQSSLSIQLYINDGSATCTILGAQMKG